MSIGLPVSISYKFLRMIKYFMFFELTENCKRCQMFPTDQEILKDPSIDDTIIGKQANLLTL